jgi:hypothetical protein
MNRSRALDALRGYAIMTMILSATEAFSVLPAWMYHAQVPPPEHAFNPHIYGITWVDLIFPFFLFSMGAAIPLSFRRQMEKGATRGQLCWKSIVRWLKLTFFAIFIYHMFPFMMGYKTEALHYVVPLMAFALLFVLFMRNPFRLSRRNDRIVNGCAYIVAIAWMLLQPYVGGEVFSLEQSDIIILILANTVVTGSILFLLTIDKPMWRMALIPVIMALFMAGKVDGSWQQRLLAFTPASWLWQSSFQEYLLIIIPGTLAGDMLWQWLHEADSQPKAHDGKAMWTALLSFTLVVGNVVTLYNRWLMGGFLFSVVTCTVLIAMLKPVSAERVYWRHLAITGAWLLLLGLIIEPFEGGIRKDDVTMSYLFTTSGLAVYGLLFFTIVCDHYCIRCISWPLEMTGRSPMVAYVASSMVVIPLLTLAGLWPLFEDMAQTPWWGFARGVILTALSMAVAIICSRLRWYWKT